MRLLNALQIKEGKSFRSDQRSEVTSKPIQFLPDSMKTNEWAWDNLDYLEYIGMKQIKQQLPRMMKSLKLKSGIVDKSEYFGEEQDGDMFNEPLNILSNEEIEADMGIMDLKFFPLVPSAVNVMETEFSKRNDKITYHSSGNKVHNEMLDQKYDEVSMVVLQQAEQKMIKSIMDSGAPVSEEDFAKMTSEENLKTLPDIQRTFEKDYRSIYEEWAGHQHEVDVDRFKMNEMESDAFSDLLTYNEEYWFFDQLEDDYNIVRWDPKITFKHKSPKVKYTSNGNYVGNIDLQTISDVIDEYGSRMTEEDYEHFKEMTNFSGDSRYLQNQRNDGSFYDPSKSHEWNTEGDPLALRQYHSWNKKYHDNDESYIESILNGTATDSELMNYEDEQLVRVTKAFWKSQRLMYAVSSKNEMGMIETRIETEDFVSFNPGIYDTSLYNEKTKDNLISGDHIEVIWINEVWGGTKLGLNSLSKRDAIYVDVKKLKFQFKGDDSLYGCKLPVEGADFSGRDRIMPSFVERGRSAQLMFNMNENQIMDIMIDEIGSVVIIDQNTLPQHSMGESWGKHNIQKAYTVMKDYQMLPLDTQLQNTETQTNFNNMQVMDLSQTQRLLTKVSLSQKYKSDYFSSIGFTPERLGSPVGQETATGIEQSVRSSHAQTDMYFVQHSEHLMPRVHQMRTDLAQYYHSTNPSLRLQYVTANDERVNFEMNGTSLLGVDINVYALTKINHRELLENMRQLVLKNNTTGASMAEMLGLLSANSAAEVTTTSKLMDARIEKQRQEEHQQALQLRQQEIDAEAAEKEAERRHEAEQNALKNATNIEVAKLRMAGFSGLTDHNEDGLPDSMDVLNRLDARKDKEDKMSFDQTKELNRRLENREKNNLKMREIQSKEKISDDKLKVAKENQTKSELKAKGKKV